MSFIEQDGRKAKRLRSQSPERAQDRLVVKEQRDSKHPDFWIPNARFWDTLPQIALTHRALDELDRQNRQREAEEVEHTGQGTNARLPPRRSSRTREHTLKNDCCFSPKFDSGLQRFARIGGPDLTTIRGLLNPTMSDRAGRPGERATGSDQIALGRRTTPYDANYEIIMNRAGVFLTEEVDENDDMVMPANYEEIMTRLARPRPSLSPSRFTERDFQKFRQEMQRASTESSTMQEIVSIVGDGKKRHSIRDVPFNNIEPFNPDVAITVPDLYDGAPPLSVDPRVSHDLDQFINPSTNRSRPAAPNYFLEGKSEAGRADAARRQAGHNGAVGARAMLMLQNYPSQNLQYDHKAYSLTSTYHNGQLMIFATHVTEPRTTEGPPQYYLTQLQTFGITGSSRSFREGVTYCRNARDLAEEHRNFFIRQANKAAQQMLKKKKAHQS